MTTHFSMCSVSVTDHACIIAQLVYLYNGARPNFCPHWSSKLTEELAVDMNEITKRCPEGDFTGNLHR